MADVIKGRPAYDAVSGFSAGVLIVNTSHPLLPGNVQNARSFSFPIIYEIVHGISFHDLMEAKEICDQPIRDAVERLESRGVNVILGACGSFGHWQKRISQYSNVPAYVSIMTQVPFVISGLPAEQKLGVVFANPDAFTQRLKDECGISEADCERMVIVGADTIPAFDLLYEEGTVADAKALEKDIVALCVKAREENPEIGAWLFQCSELPVYAAAVQEATGLVVFDMTVLIDHLYRVATRTRYA